MKSRIIITALLCLLLSAGVFAKINLPKADKIKLDNGLTILVVERPELPLFTMELCFRAGSIYDPIGKEGLANLCSTMLMRGTKSRSAKQIAEEVSFGGGTLNSYCGRETAGFSGEFLAENGVKGFQILADVLLNASFATDEFIKIRNRTVGELNSRFDDPSTIATENIYSQVLGDSRYAHIPAGKTEAVSTLSRDEVIDFYHEAYSPKNCIFILCGDINKKAVKSWAKQYLGTWKSSAGFAAVSESYRPVTDKKILILDKPDATQTQIRVGNLGINRNHEEYIPFETARTVFAGSFTSRLVNEIRVKRGLTYGVSMRSARFGPCGMVYTSTFTKNESVGEVLEIILNETERIMTEEIPADELNGAINYRTGLYPLNFETNDDIADIYTNLWLYNLEKSYYELFQENMKTMTAETVLNTTQRHFPLSDYRIVLVGKAEDIKSLVEKYGSVTVKPYVENN